ncbi:ABC transporter ATP-binding protein [Halalkalibacter nanhaiisediminis]|uniref:Carnitine transport ATP-binding protein OpuCA n=1 Tax=Halalkalibacter nanhaiisediminis TaxID=688079 RepID=A0A562QHK7_9BACI|nr:ABC transporter ATP-binding protein [Halalkalibacter nanhaiisediminis]TWI56242.1 NitT/TauT family transport system ATP-binding protein [Halalkalibacter nanhaiisediminis]
MHIEIKNVNKSFFHKQKGTLKVLDQINVDIEQGQFVSILGPSGCGKTTMLNLIAGLEKEDDGEVLVNGKKINGPGTDRIVVFQESGLFPWLSVIDNVMYGLKIKKMPKKEAEEKALNILKMVHLSRYKDAYPHELSGGMKQRVAIARALVMEPDILLMDEPFAALDEQTRMTLHKELIDIWRKTKLTVIFITHNIREAVKLSQRIVVMGTRPGYIKKEFTVNTMQSGIMTDNVMFDLEQRILAVLQEEIEKVLKEEMGDDYSLDEENPVHRDSSGDMGSHI